MPASAFNLVQSKNVLFGKESKHKISHNPNLHNSDERKSNAFEKILGKEKMLYFLIFPQCFQKHSFYELFGERGHTNIPITNDLVECQYLKEKDNFMTSYQTFCFLSGQYVSSILSK